MGFAFVFDKLTVGNLSWSIQDSELMLRSSSAPADLCKCACLTGTVWIKNSPSSDRIMVVQFKADSTHLQINLTQQTMGRWHSFQLCRLLVSDLAAAKDRNDDVFVLAAVHDNNAWHDIYCYPKDLSPDTWLCFFASAGMQSISSLRSRRRTCLLAEHVPVLYTIHELSSSISTDSVN
jgi:hypothetical protein